ncbi:hypothetical protein Tco_0269693 [Tanacetum coccineum]
MSKPIEFSVDNRVLLKVSPWKGIVRIGKRSKLAARYVGPFEIVERIDPIAYRLRPPQELSGIHDMFHVSNLKKCFVDVNLWDELNFGTKFPLMGEYCDNYLAQHLGSTWRKYIHFGLSLGRNETRLQLYPRTLEDLFPDHGDGSGQRRGDKVVGGTASKLEDKDPYYFSSLITTLEGKQYIFQFHINPSRKACHVDFIVDNILNQTPAAITSTSNTPLAIMANLAEESSGSSTTTLENISDISTLLALLELHLADKSSISSKPNTKSDYV